MLYEAVGAAADPASGGRQMPSHWGHKSFNIVSASSPTGTQFLQGVGSAEATLRAKLLDISEGFQRDEVVLISTGEGQTSEGEFWESLNTAANLKLPAVYLVEDNGYAISVPVEVNTAGGNISKLVRSFPNLYVEEVDGCDLLASYDALAQPQPGPETVYFGVYSPDVDPTGEQFDTEDDPQFSGEPTTMVDLLNACMKDEMRRDKKILVFGQDVADVSREENLGKVKGKGGVFKVTWGLQKEFGGARVYNSPLAEANIVGRAIGLSGRGFKPVVEIQFFDYIWTAYMQLRDELATMRWRSNNNFSAPVVVRTTYGGYIRGAIYHSQTGATLFTHCPGLRVVCPATALDANGLLRTAIRCDDPVIFLEHKHLYRQTYNKSPNPGPNFMIPFGKAKVVREGTALTVVTYGAVVQRTLVAAKELEEKDGVSVEVIDLRSLSPVDWGTIEASVRKTNKVIIAYEDAFAWGYGAEIAARIADQCFPWLDAPVRRVASTDKFVGYAPNLEDYILPQVEDLAQAMRELHAF